MRHALILAVMLCSLPSLGRAHSWYDGYCCSVQDCAPANRVDQRPDGSVVLWSGGKPNALPKGFPYRPSLDENWHICIANGHVRCVYMPAGS